MYINITYVAVYIFELIITNINCILTDDPVNILWEPVIEKKNKILSKLALLFAWFIAIYLTILAIFYVTYAFNRVDEQMWFNVIMNAILIGFVSI